MVIALDGSGGVVYEALGSYIDGLCSSNFLGTARGKVVLYKMGTYPLTPTKKLPFLNVFYSRGMLEITGIWNRDGKSGAFLLKMVPSGIEVREKGIIYITFRPRDGGIVLVILYGNEGLARTLKGAVMDCGRGRGKEEKILSSVSPR
ncbi:hypothetical protein [Thermococcus thioreducens]|uniref:Uncharacterized protein n=1 Tax=Thermococcus thioreducens TaxID=277988 RepID=A0A1I0PJ22_9EURY|nr:hypothetical protein [Thermococcus thioreducens]SEW14416.1 hypothetical protein SAMN05216170_1857 [Thermococcus thioreducens]